MTTDKKTALLRRKADVDERIGRLKAKLRRTNAVAASRSIFMDPNEYAKLELQLAQLTRESQNIQTDLSNLPKQ
jgi:hypothetical protein